ncbi:hypothetical protein JW813_05240 [Clostridium botulinum]|uniref:hypothetical protein n=1 Tax=Clostridium botulinum TaxID=1491 RepID=UPI002245E11C|nr:hypothetical protein [Clostridium botulinum]UZP04413.1 hypothetical protein JW813_05240 [Clostridium botulinum]UZP07825.1 hypothetical protein JYA71_05515 [Clostridium botulinum]UZP11152.1 hypothetical protein JYA74_05235 [Clostridium botulinum]
MRNYIPKNLQKLYNEELEPCPQNDKLFESLLYHVKQEKIINRELKKNNDLKTLITLGNSLNANTKSIIALMNTFIYKELEEEF